MHERTLCQSLLRRVLEIAVQEGARAITSVTVQVGAHSGIDPGQLQADFPQVSSGTAADGARLVIESVALRVRCLACGGESEPPPGRMHCSNCGSEETQLLAGTELLVTNVGLRL